MGGEQNYRNNSLVTLAAGGVLQSELCNHNVEVLLANV